MEYTPINITEAGKEYLQSLLSQKSEGKWGVRVYVLNPGTPQAETCLSYCQEGAQQPEDYLIENDVFPVYIATDSEKFLHEAEIDYSKDEFGGQLTIKAPHSRLSDLSDDSTIEERVNHAIWNDINPMLASHGGQVSLVEITDEKNVVLQFGGGCQGCGMVDVTLKQGIEQQLKDAIPQINKVIDITDHTVKENAYY